MEKVSIIIYSRNMEDCIWGCLNRCVHQDWLDTEVIVVDDCSMDSTVSIIQQFSGIKLIQLEEFSDICDSFNFGIQQASGDYINCIYGNRAPSISHVSFLMCSKKDTDVNVTFSSDVWSSAYITDPIQLNDINIERDSLLIKRSSLDSLPFAFENMFASQESKKFCQHALAHGLSVYTSRGHLDTIELGPDPWRTQEALDRTSQSLELLCACDWAAESKKDFTAIIAFWNEGLEVEKTVSSIRATAKSINIMLIDDGSTDGYDYEKVAQMYNCSYKRNSESIGQPDSFNMAIHSCPSEHFILLDAHMRFYQRDWDVYILKQAQLHPHDILFTDTAVMGYNKYKNLKQEQVPWVDHQAIGAYVGYNPGYEFNAEWSYIKLPERLEIQPVPCCLGATYTMSKKWWDHIWGMCGQLKYGRNEANISIKTWLAGGQVLRLNNIYVGHLYRDMSPDRSDASVVYNIHNSIFLTFMFRPERFDEVCEIHKNAWPETYEQARALFDKYADDHEHWRLEFWNNIAVRNMDWYNKFNEQFKG